jgi:hypothetical protein
MRLLLQGHLDLPQRVTLDVVLKDLHPFYFRVCIWNPVVKIKKVSSTMVVAKTIFQFGFVRFQPSLRNALARVLGGGACPEAP